jgi:membrane protein YdbS with pleckstrin-like domain
MGGAGADSAMIARPSVRLSSGRRAMDKSSQAVSSFIRTIGAAGSLVLFAAALMGNPYNLSSWTIWGLAGVFVGMAVITLLVDHKPWSWRIFHLSHRRDDPRVQFASETYNTTFRYISGKNW